MEYRVHSKSAKNKRQTKQKIHIIRSFTKQYIYNSLRRIRRSHEIKSQDLLRSFVRNGCLQYRTATARSLMQSHEVTPNANIVHLWTETDGERLVAAQPLFLLYLETETWLSVHCVRLINWGSFSFFFRTWANACSLWQIFGNFFFYLIGVVVFVKNVIQCTRTKAPGDFHNCRRSKDSCRNHSDCHLCR